MPTFDILLKKEHLKTLWKRRNAGYQCVLPYNRKKCTIGGTLTLMLSA